MVEFVDEIDSLYTVSIFQVNSFASIKMGARYLQGNITHLLQCAVFFSNSTSF